MKKPKIIFNTDRLMGFSALMVSLMTLFIFLYQTNLMKEQSRLSVRPQLTFNKKITNSVTVDDKDSIISKVVKLSLTVRNNGLGPAIIESGKIVDNGKVYDILSFFDRVYPKLKDYGVFTQTSELEEEGVIPASEIINVFTYEYNAENEKKIYDYLGSPEYYQLPFRVRIEYASFYQEKWIVESAQGH